VKIFQYPLLPGILLPLCLLSACGGSSGGSEATTNNIAADVEPVTGRVTFYTKSAFHTPAAVFRLTDEQDLLGTLDSLHPADACSLTDGFNSPILLTGGFQSDETDPNNPTVSAGDELAINVNSNFLVNLLVSNNADQISYSLGPDDGPIAGPLTGEVSVSIPGSADVSSFVNERVPDVEDIIVLNNDLSTLDINTALQWQAPTLDNENSRMTVNIGIFLIEPTSENGLLGINTLQCVMEDDGSFLFPEELTPFVDQKSVITIAFTRTAWRTVQNGNTTLHLMNKDTAILNPSNPSG